MTACDDFIQKLNIDLPDLCSVKNLVAIGLFGSCQSARYARLMKDTPSYFKIRGKIFYPKASVIAYLERKKFEGAHEECLQATKFAGHKKISC